MRPQFCPLTGASVDASRAGSRVDFTSTCCRVTPTRGSLVQSKRYLSHSSPLSLLLGQAYQSFAILSTFLILHLRAVAKSLIAACGGRGERGRGHPEPRQEG